jgi:hypothetical protein
MTTVTNTIARNALTPKEGEVVFMEEENEFYLYHNDEYTLIPNEAKVKLGLYDMNAQIISQLATLNRETIRSKRKDFKDFINKADNNFYMLYGKEISYFTLFNILDPNVNYVGAEVFSDFYEVFIECLKNIGEIKSLELTTTKDAFEIWVKTPEDKTTCLYFFPYDTGIVYIQEAR